MKKISQFTAVLVALLSVNLATVSTAKAESYIGGLIGVGTASGTAADLNSGLALGGTVGYRLMPELGVAATYLHSALKTKGIEVDYGVNQYMAELNFFTVFFMQGGLHVGAVNTSILGASSTDFGAGAQVGIDIKLTEQVSVGAQVYYTYVTQDNDKHSLFNFIVPIKVWF